MARRRTEEERIHQLVRDVDELKGLRSEKKSKKKAVSVKLLAKIDAVERRITRAGGMPVNEAMKLFDAIPAAKRRAILSGNGPLPDLSGIVATRHASADIFGHDAANEDEEIPSPTEESDPSVDGQVQEHLAPSVAGQTGENVPDPLVDALVDAPHPLPTPNPPRMPDIKAPPPPQVPGHIRTLAETWPRCLGVTGLVSAEFALLAPTMQYMRPGEVGGVSLWMILALMIPMAEVLVCLQRAKAKGTRYVELTALMIGLAVAQCACTYLAEQAGVYGEQVHVAQAAGQARTRCVKEEMPESYAGHPQSINAWNASHPDPEGEFERCQDHERANAKADASDQVAAVAAHLPWEKWLLAGISGIVSMVIGNCAESITEFQMALLALRTWKRREEPAPEEDSETPEPPRELDGSVAGLRRSRLGRLLLAPGAWLKRHRLLGFRTGAEQAAV